MGIGRAVDISRFLFSSCMHYMSTALWFWRLMSVIGVFCLISRVPFAPECYACCGLAFSFVPSDRTFRAYSCICISSRSRPGSYSPWSSERPINSLIRKPVRHWPGNASLLCYI